MRINRKWGLNRKVICEVTLGWNPPNLKTHSMMPQNNWRT